MQLDKDGTQKREPVERNFTDLALALKQVTFIFIGVDIAMLTWVYTVEFLKVLVVGLTTLGPVGAVGPSAHGVLWGPVCTISLCGIFVAS